MFCHVCAGANFCQAVWFAVEMKHSSCVMACHLHHVAPPSPPAPPTGPMMLLGPTMDPRIAAELALRLPHLGLRIQVRRWQRGGGGGPEGQGAVLPSSYNCGDIPGETLAARGGKSLYMYRMRCCSSECYLSCAGALAAGSCPRRPAPVPGCPRHLPRPALTPTGGSVAPRPPGTAYLLWYCIGPWPAPQPCTPLYSSALGPAQQLGSYVTTISAV
jgi:hypothetical protein